jgi:hypothetical protein
VAMLGLYGLECTFISSLIVLRVGQMWEKFGVSSDVADVAMCKALLGLIAENVRFRACDLAVPESS